MPMHSTVSRAQALTAMQTVFSGLEARVIRQRMLPHPVEGGLFDVDPNRLSRRSYREGNLGPGDDGAFVRREAVGVLHKQLLGSSAMKVCVVLDFAFDDNKDQADRLDDVARWALAHQRPDVYFIFGLASVRGDSFLGHDDALLRALSSGTNWRACLVESVGEGWLITSPDDGLLLTGLFENLFDPEPDEQKISRVDSALDSALELQEPGGFLMIDDFANKIGVSMDLVKVRAMMYADRTPGVVVKDVSGSTIIQRDRFESVGAK